MMRYPEQAAALLERRHSDCASVAMSRWIREPVMAILLMQTREGDGRRLAVRAVANLIISGASVHQSGQRPMQNLLNPAADMTSPYAVHGR